MLFAKSLSSFWAESQLPEYPDAARRPRNRGNARRWRITRCDRTAIRWRWPPRSTRISRASPLMAVEASAAVDVVVIEPDPLAPKISLAPVGCID